MKNLLNPLNIKSIIFKVEYILNEDILTIEKMNTGMTNDNFKIHTKKNIYILRIPGIASNLLVNRKEEHEVIKKIKDLEIDVETIFYDPVTSWKITRFIDSFFEHTSTKKKILITSKLLTKLHQSKLYFENKFSIISKIEEYEEIISKNNIQLEPTYFNVKKQIIQLNAFLLSKKQNSICACHNDLVPDNILLDKSGNSYLIDWEYAGMNDPLWDIASFCLENDLTTCEENLFFQLYLKKNVTEDLSQIILIHKIFQDILWSLWSLIKTFFGCDYAQYGKLRYDRGLTNLKKFQ